MCGDCTVTIFSMFGGIIFDIGHFALKVLATVILGAAGGLAGLVTKDLYNKWKAKRSKTKII